MLFLMKSCMKNLKLIFVLTLKLTLVLALEMTLVLTLASTRLCNLAMTLGLTVKLPLVLTLEIHQRIDPRIVRQGPSCLMAPHRWPVFKSTLVCMGPQIDFRIDPILMASHRWPASQTNDMQ